MSTTISADQLNDLSDYLMNNASFNLPEENEGIVFRADYSGRGMYSRECLGIVISGSNVFELAFLIAAWLAEADADVDLKEEFMQVSVDSMGYGMIYYWRGITVAEMDDAEDDDADGMKAEAWADEVRPH